MISRNLLNRLYLVSLYLLVTLAFLALSTGGGLSLLVSAFYVLGIFASLSKLQISMRETRFAPLWNTSILLTLAYTVVDVVVLDGSILNGGTRLIAILTIIKRLS